ncbi:MAG: LysR substrate-binding domain-containing protein [Pseudomonadota bacterium]
MDQLAAIRAFLAVAEAGGFAKAARRAGVATSSLTRQVDGLERHLAVRLFNRSTRQVTLTAAGVHYRRQVLEILDDLESADESVGEADGPPRGQLRVAAPVAFARLHIAPYLAAFLERYPAIEVDLRLSDRLVDLVDERLDLAVRLGVLPPSRLLARRLAPHRRVLCASPAYLDRQGVPKGLDDLATHNCLTLGGDRPARLWHFIQGDEVQTVRVGGSLCADNSEVLHQAALCGAGLVVLPTWLVGDDLKAGRLQPLLTAWQAGPDGAEGAISAVTLSNRRGSKKIGAFVDFLRQRYGDPPYWDIAG